jgi:nitroreductase
MALNETMRAIRSRKSVRAFTESPISEEIKAQLLEAAFQAPTAGNMMLYTILDITDAALKEKLADACDHQPFIAKAPLVLVFLADWHRWLETFRAANLAPRAPGPGNLLLAMADALIAAQNVVVAAEAFGLGSCYIGDILENCEAVRALLNLPEAAVPAAMLVIGHPTPQQQARRKPARFAKRFIVFENAYRAPTPQDCRDAYLEREADDGRANAGFEALAEAFWKRKYESAFALEMDRSAQAYLSAFTKKC